MALEVFEATLGGTNVEPIVVVVVETDVLRLLLRLVDAERVSVVPEDDKGDDELGA